MLILDVGCGTGNLPVRGRIETGDIVVGAEFNLDSLRIARNRFPDRAFLCCRAEDLPLADSSFDRIVSALAVPYTDIPVALAEMRRVLRPRGSLFLSLHPLSFTLKELREALPRPVATMFRLYVIANGTLFHASGKTARFPNGRNESFQTKRGMTTALNRAGFENIVFSQPDGRLLVEAIAAPLAA